MTNTKGYEVIDHDEVTVHKTVSSLVQADGSMFHQNGMGRTYVLGEIVPPDEVAEDWKEALEKGDENDPLYRAVSAKLRPVGDEPAEDVAQRLGLPFVGYDEMDADDIVNAMRVFPSATIQKIKDYESRRDDPRHEIIDYNIGYGEHPDARQNAEIEDTDVDETKAVRRLTTREVPEDGPVQRGEGVTGTGDPQTPYGVVKDAEEGDADAQKDKVISKARGAAGGSRRGRRERTPKPATGTGEGGSSLETTND